MTGDRVKAQDAVFNTSELIELILLSVPAENVLFAAHVNQHWYSVIGTSAFICARIQHGLNPPSDIWHRPAAMRHHVKCSFSWGKFIVRRVGDSECIAVLPHSMPNRDSRLTRPVITGKGGKLVKIRWNGKRAGWKVEFRNAVTGTRLSGLVPNYSDSRLVMYLAQYYGGHRMGLRVAKPQGTAEATLARA